MSFRTRSRISLSRKLWIIALITGFFFTEAFAQIPARPSPPRLVNNLSKQQPGFLSQQQEKSLERTLRDFSEETSNQICIVIVDDLNGMDEASFSTKILNDWGIGSRKNNNGVVILVKPTGGEGQRKLFISVGYGLEGAITDLQTKHIRENDIVPYFQKGQYYEGLLYGVQSLMQAAKGEYNTGKKRHRQPEGNWVQEHPIIFLILVILAVYLIFRTGGGGGLGGITYFGGGFGRGFGGGGGGFSGGGGFGGFGGGRGGGGGSGGSW